MSYLRDTVVSIMQKWIGKNEKNGGYKSIIDIYNTIKPLPAGYKVKYTDAWCATAVSAAFHQAGYDKIFPSECSCSRMIKKAQTMGIWVENDAYVPKPGDCILYDWEDTGNGDNTGNPDHIGMIESVVGKAITVIEGNMSDAVNRRTLSINGKYIRGFITPNFDAEDDSQTTTPAQTTTTTTTTSTITKVQSENDAASKFQKSLSGNYKVTAASGLHLRTGASTSKTSITIMPKDTVAINYGYYSVFNGTKWLYVQVVMNNKQYTGFCSSQYLKKF